MSETTKKACPNDTNGDGDCGRPLCPHCAPIGRDAPSDSERLDWLFVEIDAFFDDFSEELPRSREAIDAAMSATPQSPTRDQEPEG